MNKKLIIMIVAGLLVGVGGTAGFFLMRPAPVAQAAPPPPPKMIAMETFLVNITDGKSDRFAKLSLKLAVAPGDLADDIEDDELLMAKMRDRVLTLLSSKSPQELVGPIGKEALRREIKTTLNPLLDGGEIDEVLFSDFVLQ